MNKRRTDEFGWTRRQFIGTASAGALGTALLPAGALAAEGDRRLNVACIGLGGQMVTNARQLAALGHRIVALCDVEAGRIPSLRGALGAAAQDAAGFKDYRELLDKVPTVDAVIVATPDHWHAPIVTAAMLAGKHVYCEKPLAHNFAETRALRELTRRLDLATQTGNQGSASNNVRRNIELLQAGLIGPVREVHVWHPEHDWPSGVDRPAGEDPVPEGLDWNFWLGPAPVRPYKAGVYHPYRWRGWYDFGSGSIGDFSCHAFNLPVRALQLGMPERIDVRGTALGKESFSASCTLRYHFPKRGDRDAVDLYFYSGGDMPPESVTGPMTETFGGPGRTGCVLVGDLGLLSAGLWNNEGYVKLNDEPRFNGIFNHEVAQAVPTSFQASPGHMAEWVNACLGGPAAVSDFDHGGHLTELGVLGALALQIGHDIEWDEARMAVKGVPEADALIRPEPRPGWNA